MLVSAIGKINTANKKDSVAVKSTFNGDKNLSKGNKTISEKAVNKTTNNKNKANKLNFWA
ncbi:MAG: hypothetical protein E7Z93_02845 [Cyanobacteria bacterium SIG32]|nr:hypothetical protein [Cyanobacteria bacterium SIG32]